LFSLSEEFIIQSITKEARSTAINAANAGHSPLKWSPANIPVQAGKLAIITGATSGLGFETAIGLAQAGADVIVAGRDESHGRWAVGKIRPLAPASLVRFEKLDLANLAVVADFARRIHEMERPIDLLINNAGVMGVPQRQVTIDGFEMQLATNFLGHFALTAHLLPLLRRGRETRVVQVSSISHRWARIDLSDLQMERRYRAYKAYAQSKLATLIFAMELQRRSDAGRWRLLSVAAHPGYARTALFEKGPGQRSLVHRIHRNIGGWLGHSAAAGALPLLYAATAPKVRPGEYYGPQGAFELAGPSGVAPVSKRARDRELARHLWEVSDKLTGALWPALEPDVISPVSC
jgi:NAD(P)-dependent dehydrogenase (short-subunit alcohol dehydrogenase family)